MESSTLNIFENKINLLSRDEQLWLIERLARRLRKRTPSEQTAIENDLLCMAADPEIQRELQEINVTF